MKTIQAGFTERVPGRLLEQMRQHLSKPLDLHKWTSERRPLLPIQPHPKATTEAPLPELPSPPRHSLIDDWYTLSTHIVPAAFPRSTPDVDHPPDIEFSANESKEEKAKRITKLRHTYFNLREKQWSGKLPGHSEKKLWSCVNRYLLRRSDAATERRKEQAGGKKLILFLSHANGFMKEIWEPCLKYLVSSSIERGVMLFDEIWAWEAVNHGDSALLNDSKLGAIYDWADNSRDILNFMLNYMPESVGGSLPIHLPRVPVHISKGREQHGFIDRILVCGGHSFGGNTATLAAINCPALFSSLILIDPIITLPPLDVAWVTQGETSQYMISRVEGALQRRTKWPSRTEAMKAFKKNPFFAVWDPAVLDIYVECGLHPDPKSGVKLKMSGALEAVAFAERRTTFEVWDLLPELDESIGLKFIIPETSAISSSSSVQELVWLRPTNTCNVRFMSMGHLVPHEGPEKLAQEIREFVHWRYGAGKAAL